ncbi:hypothetical protein [Paenibacillus alvei]|uniref:hypothetical protein n=2 Tax=Paenibacillus alvei TaxID=44250 RepID=UPI0018CF33C2|nr:hypothetical protein [Paenibacillus alvei]MCY9581173.1 hypothetical protein [Paenibacillus alvei]
MLKGEVDMSGTYQNGSSPKLDLEQIVFIGRTYDEYVSMFNLKVDEMLRQTIVGLSSGSLLLYR